MTWHAVGMVWCGVVWFVLMLRGVVRGAAWFAFSLIHTHMSEWLPVCIWLARQETQLIKDLRVEEMVMTMLGDVKLSMSAAQIQKQKAQEKAAARRKQKEKQASKAQQVGWLVGWLAGRPAG